jgi:lysophospholipase L1-like esterase
MTVRPAAPRRWLFRLLALLMGLLPLLLIEAGLRRFAPLSETAREGIDHDPLVDLHQLEPLFVASDDGTRWEIPPARWNFFRPASFRRVKPAGAFRVFVLGGSTVQGRPYATETAFPAFLQIHWQTAHPELPLEVINCGGVSYASYRVAALLDEVLTHEPDLVILYTGHNEFLEDRTYAAWRRVPRAFTPLVAWGTRSQLVQRLSGWLRAPVEPTVEPTVMPREVAARLDRGEAGLARFRRDPTWRGGVERHYQQTLARMVARCAEAEVPLWLCVPASDLVETPPFKVTVDPDLPAATRKEVAARWQTLQQDTTLPPELRVAQASQILAQDPHHAGAAYLVGLDSWERGDFDRAKRWLEVARDHDVCPLRATAPIVQSVRAIAAEEDVVVLDIPERFDQRRGEMLSEEGDGIADPEWFVDHVHPSVAGHQRIAEALYEQGRRDARLPVGRLPVASETEPGGDLTARRQAVAAHLETLDESYFQRGKQRLEGLRAWAAGRSRPVAEPASAP